MFPLFIPIPARMFGIGMMIFSAVMGFMSEDGIAHFAHFGGALTGLLLIKFGEKTPLFKIARKYLKFGIPSNEYFGHWQQRNKFNNKNEFTYHTTVSNFEHQENRNFTQQTPPAKSINLNEFEVGGVKITQATIDSILDKIAKSGYQSLTEQEKYILTEISKKL
jgi:hypothetical protein